MLTVDEARQRILEAVEPVARTEQVGLLQARQRVLAQPLRAKLTQPPFNASAMDGYAVRAEDVATLPSELKVIGEAAAGHLFSGTVGSGEAVRIFTGAPLPAGADAIVIQENVERNDDIARVVDGAPDKGHVRKRGGDFTEGDTLLAAGTRLTSRSLTLAAAMGHGELTVRARPVVAILATGDELVPPSISPGPGQIVASNAYGIAAMVEGCGGEPRVLGIASDNTEGLSKKIAEAADADVLVTIGGASVGDHDLVSKVLQERGMVLDFWKIAMRPGKPLLFGRLGGQRVIGVPGNPVSSLICSRVFLVPLVEALLGVGTSPAALEQSLLPARLTSPLSKNGPRLHFMRASYSPNSGHDGAAVTPAVSQDSSLMAILAASNCLIVRPPHAEALPIGGSVGILPLDF